jgi:hypothetical protein
LPDGSLVGLRLPGGPPDPGALAGRRRSPSAAGSTASGSTRSGSRRGRAGGRGSGSRRTNPAGTAGAGDVAEADRDGRSSSEEAALVGSPTTPDGQPTATAER